MVSHPFARPPHGRRPARGDPGKANGWGAEQLSQNPTLASKQRCGEGGASRRFEELLFLEDGCVLFVGEDGRLEAAEIGGFCGWNLDLADHIFAFVVEEIAFGQDFGVITREVEVEVDWVWSFIDDVAGWDDDVETVAPAACGLEVDGIDAGLVVEGPGIGADDAGTHEQ